MIPIEDAPILKPIEELLVILNEEGQRDGEIVLITNTEHADHGQRAVLNELIWIGDAWMWTAHEMQGFKETMIAPADITVLTASENSGEAAAESCGSSKNDQVDAMQTSRQSQDAWLRTMHCEYSQSVAKIVWHAHVRAHACARITMNAMMMISMRFACAYIFVMSCQWRGNCTLRVHCERKISWQHWRTESESLGSYACSWDCTMHRRPWDHTTHCAGAQVQVGIDEKD